MLNLNIEDFNRNICPRKMSRFTLSSPNKTNEQGCFMTELKLKFRLLLHELDINNVLIIFARITVVNDFVPFSIYPITKDTSSFHTTPCLILPLPINVSKKRESEKLKKADIAIFLSPMLLVNVFMFS